MSSDGSFESAYLEVLEGKHEGKKEEFMYNPKEVEEWEENDYSTLSNQLNSPQMVFAGGGVTYLWLVALVDTTDSGTTVRDNLKVPNLGMKVDGELHRPPQLGLGWGAGLYREVFIVRTNKRFTRRQENGVPERVWVGMLFAEMNDTEQQMKKIKHESTDKRKTVIVSEGKTLMLIAQEEYGDASYWRTIADANGIDNPRWVEPGTELSLPPL